MTHRTARLLAALALFLCAGPVHAQLLLLGVGKPVAVAGFSINYPGSPFDSGSISTTTPSTTAIAAGAANNHRLVVAAIAATDGSGHTLTGCTIGASSMNAVVTDTGTRTLDIYELVVTTGTTVTIACTFSSAVTRFSVDVWTVLNATGDAFSNRSNTVAKAASAATLSIESLTIPTSGGAIASCRSTSTTNAFTWSQDTGSAGTQNSDHSNGTTIRQTAYTDTPGVGAVVYTCAQTGGTLLRGAAVSFGP